MANKKTILSEEIELSEIVLEKTNQAFEMIKQEDIVCMKKTHTKDKKVFKTQAAVIAGVCILAVSSLRGTCLNNVFHISVIIRIMRDNASIFIMRDNTSIFICRYTVFIKDNSIIHGAAIHHYWGRGMNGIIQASDEQQQVLTEKNIAKVYSEEPNSPSLAVTNNGVTIEPDTVIVDERFVYMAFRISGYSVADRMEPGFDMVNVYQGDNPEDESAWVNMSGTMYDGIILELAAAHRMPE